VRLGDPRVRKTLYWLLGIGLLAWIAREADLGAVLARAREIGVGGMAVVLAIYLAAFVIDTWTWQMTLPSLPLDARSLYRLWKVRMVGEAVNATTPAAGLGGEPVKAVLLKRHCGIGYREGTASLVLARTINILALLLFLTGGYLLVLRAPDLPAGFRAVAGAGLAVSVAGGLALWALQRFRITSLAGTFAAGFPAARRIERVLGHVRDVDDLLVAFYTLRRGRFAAATALAFVNWWLGAVEVWFVLRALGHPLPLGDAWIIESAAQLVRLGAFFIPASLGAQEGAFFLVGEALAGSATLGVAVGLVRRFRELLWILWGFALAAWLGRRGAGAASAS